MKLHEAATAPNCRRVRIFLAEKGIEVPIVPVDLGKAENRQAPFRQMNPMGRVPVLELDDGTFIAESVAICRYFEQVQPEPALMGGADPEQAARIEMWQRRMELEVALPIMQVFRNTHPFLRRPLRAVPRLRRRSAPLRHQASGLARRGVGQPRVRRRRRLHDRRHHGPDWHRLRPGHQVQGDRGNAEPVALAPGGVGAAEREGVANWRAAGDGQARQDPSNFVGALRAYFQ